MSGCLMDTHHNGFSNYLLERVYMNQLQKEIRDKVEQKTPSIKDNGEFRMMTTEEVSFCMDQACTDIRHIFKDIKRRGEISVNRVKQEIIPVIKSASSSPRIFELLHQTKRKEEYTYWHSICVGILSGLIGRWLRLPIDELEDLMISAVLHDIGMTMVPENILDKSGKLTSQEYNIMKQHTVYGHELLSSLDHIPDSAAIVALQHHEREDGMGYPHGLKGKQIHYFAKIVAIADIYHAMSSERVYHEATPFYLIIKQMQNDVYGTLDAHILLVFMDRLLQALVGKKVKLNNGEYGSILLINRYNPLKSLIKTERGIIDLMAFRDIEIVKIINEV